MATDLSTEFPTTADRENEISRLAELAIDFADRAGAAEAKGNAKIAAQWEASAEEAQTRVSRSRGGGL